MNCTKCGAPLKPGASYCPSCGNRIAQPVQNNQYNQYNRYPNNTQPVANAQGVANNQNNINIKVNKKTAKLAGIIAAGVAVLVVALVIVISVTSKARLRQPITIDLNDYISEQVTVDAGNSSPDEGDDYDEDDTEGDEPAQNEYVNTDLSGLKVVGYDGYASVYTDDLYNVINWEQLNSDFSEKISKKKGYETTTINDFIGNNAFTYNASKNESISNGDEIEVSVSSSAEKYSLGELTLKVKPASKKYKVSGLQKVNAFDPFEYVKVVLSGANGHASAEISIDEGLNEELSVKGMSVQNDSGKLAILKDNYIISRVSFYFSNDGNYKHDYSNGDTITLECSCNETQSLIDNEKLYIVRFTKEYQVANLGDYINKDFEFSADDLAAFKTDAEQQLKDYNEYSDYYDYKFVKARIYDLKDKTSTSNDFSNELVIVMSYKYNDSWSETVETRYAFVSYENLVAKDGKITSSASSYCEDVTTISDVNSLDDYYSPDTYNFRDLG